MGLGRKNTTLTTLDLCGNPLGPEGGKVIADALRRNCTLTHLKLSNNYIGPEVNHVMIWDINYRRRPYTRFESVTIPIR
ncbi:12832_t:CDS:2 [Cetraspora pellucida]|uniref:12832_t:CDS:1 n=1 Tax=Cetraspora pellucida TaxID=1433469 RepID=A0A9N9EVN1_9GLOM|nr:12832_t:CDS:2 [Cetraspora pellucida]